MKKQTTTKTWIVKIVHLGMFVEKIEFLDIFSFKKQKECLIDKTEISENRENKKKAFSSRIFKKHFKNGGEARSYCILVEKEVLFNLFHFFHV